MNARPLLLALLLGLSVPVAAVAADAAAAPSARKAVTFDSVVRHYADLVYANYSDTLSAAQAMQKDIGAFIAAPSEAGLVQARKAWLAAREFYGQTEAFRFYGGPIDGDDGPEGQLNAWPMDESYVDSVQDNPKSGLINNPAFEITAAALAAQNERGGEENIATGWHAIEFLLWGQDLSETGPGARAYTDFVDGKAPNADRRRTYLKVVTQLLVDDLTMVTTAWAPGNKKNYRYTFERGGRVSVQRMLVALGSLSRGELSGERLDVALNSQDQEDEHSCFSDNTNRDVVNNARGMLNVWSGIYRRADGTELTGPSLAELVAAQDATLAQQTSNRIENSVTLAEAIQAPFDREIVGNDDAPGRKRIQETVQSLVAQSKDIVSAASAIGIRQLTLVQP